MSAQGQAGADTAALLTPIGPGRVLAALCGLNRVRAQVLETAAGALAVLDDASLENLDHAARAVSVFVRHQPVLAMDRRDGQITVRRWLAGAAGDTVPPGLALDNAPSEMIAIMTGAQTMSEIAATHPDAVIAAPRGRWRAFRQLRAAARQARRTQSATQGGGHGGAQGGAQGGQTER